MRILIIIIVFVFSTSVSYSSEKEPATIKSNKTNATLISPTKLLAESTEIPPDGKYRYDIAFAEWNGKSMGEKVTVVIKGDSVKVIYEGNGQLTLTEPGEIIDEGILRKHKSGKWIISKSENDTEIDEIGGCTDGPSVIDFKNKKYWMC